MECLQGQDRQLYIWQINRNKAGERELRINFHFSPSKKHSHPFCLREGTVMQLINIHQVSPDDYSFVPGALGAQEEC